MGVSIPVSPASSQSSDDVSRNSIIQFLILQNPTLFNYFLIISSTQDSYGSYSLDLLTLYGTYFARVSYKNFLVLSGITQTSNNLCSDLSSSEVTSNTVVAALRSYLSTSYAMLNGYSLQLVQGFINSSGSINYRFLYGLGSNRYEFQMVYSNAIGKYLINKVTQYNSGNCNLN
jgi:hypothetical protein